LFIVVTDEEENSTAMNLMFDGLFQKYLETVNPNAKVFFVSFLRVGAVGHMVPKLLRRGIPAPQFRMDPSRPDLSKFDGIMEQVLVALKSTGAHFHCPTNRKVDLPDGFLHCDEAECAPLEHCRLKSSYEDMVVDGIAACGGRMTSNGQVLLVGSEEEQKATEAALKKLTLRHTSVSFLAKQVLTLRHPALVYHTPAVGNGVALFGDGKVVRDALTITLAIEAHTKVVEVPRNCHGAASKVAKHPLVTSMPVDYEDQLRFVPVEPTEEAFSAVAAAAERVMDRFNERTVTLTDPTTDLRWLRLAIQTIAREDAGRLCVDVDEPGRCKLMGFVEDAVLDRTAAALGSFTKKECRLPATLLPRVMGKGGANLRDVNARFPNAKLVVGDTQLRNLFRPKSSQRSAPRAVNTPLRGEETVVVWGFDSADVQGAFTAVAATCEKIAVPKAVLPLLLGKTEGGRAWIHDDAPKDVIFVVGSSRYVRYDLRQLRPGHIGVVDKSMADKGEVRWGARVDDLAMAELSGHALGPDGAALVREALEAVAAKLESLFLATMAVASSNVGRLVGRKGANLTSLQRDGVQVTAATSALHIVARHRGALVKAVRHLVASSVNLATRDAERLNFLTAGSTHNPASTEAMDTRAADKRWHLAKYSVQVEAARLSLTFKRASSFSKSSKKRFRLFKAMAASVPNSTSATSSSSDDDGQEACSDTEFDDNVREFDENLREAVEWRRRHKQALRGFRHMVQEHGPKKNRQTNPWAEAREAMLERR